MPRRMESIIVVGTTIPARSKASSLVAAYNENEALAERIAAAAREAGADYVLVKKPEERTFKAAEPEPPPGAQDTLDLDGGQGNPPPADPPAADDGEFTNL